MSAQSGLLRQPKAVFAVAFACVISFMGIGLVDPILPALSTQLHATPAQVSLLFTSYLLVTAVAMLVTNWVSSRIGAKRTLVVGLILIVIFAGLAGLSGSINGIAGFRAGWGLGNALFIATSLAVIVASATGGFSGAIILYEAALGIGIACGPLLGGLLGGISWRGPFFGVSVLMAIALAATIFLVPATPKPDHKTSLSAPLKALRYKGLLIMSVTALFYNWGFFTLLGYAPYPMGLSAHKLGLVFTGWGLLVALFSVAGAPRLQRRFGTARTLYANLVFLAVVLGAIGLFTDTPAVVIVATIASGAFIGINNTLTTQAVMTVAPVERPVASAAYGFVRFIGGGLAPFVAGKLAEHYNIHVPFLMGGASFLIAIAVLATGHRILAAAEQPAEEPTTAHAPIGEVLEVARRGAGDNAPIVVAVDDGDVSDAVTTRAIELANARQAPVDLVHVHEISVVADESVDRESLQDAQALVHYRLDQLAEGGVDAVGHLLRTVADHGSAGRLIAEHANAVGAQLLVIGDGTSGALARLLGQASTQQLLADVDSDVLVVEPDPAERTTAP